jgi:hypothetical protein
MKATHLILIAAIPNLSACEHREPEPPPELSQWQQTLERRPIAVPIEHDEPEQQETQAEPTSTQPEQHIKVPKQQSAPEILEQPDTVEYKLLGAPKPLHYGGIYRRQVKIELPEGLEREQVAAALEKAARDIAQGRRADAVAVLAYSPDDDSELPPGVGEGVLAPNGDWAEAGEPDPVRFKVTFIRESYLNPPEAIELFVPGTEVKLHAGVWDDFIRVSRNKDEWGEDVEIARVPEGTKAVILKRTSEALTPEVDFVRYRIEFEYEGKTLKGWVHKSAVEGEKEPDSGG